MWYVMLVAQLPSYAGTKWYVMLVAKAGLPCKHPQKHAAAFRRSTTISILQALQKLSTTWGCQNANWDA